MIFDDVIENNVSKMKEEIELGADIHAVDYRDLTPLMHASRFDHFDTVKLLTESGADVNNFFKFDSFERTMSQPFYQDYIENHLHFLTTENLKVWKSFRLKNLFV